MWRLDRVTSWSCDELTVTSWLFDELTMCELVMWRVDWQPYVICKVCGGNLRGVMRGMQLLVSDFLCTSQFTHFSCLPLDAWNARCMYECMNERTNERTTACTVVQAVVKANSQSNGKGQILTPWGSETPEQISMKLGIYNQVAGMPTHANSCGTATTWVVWANTWKTHVVVS